MSKVFNQHNKPTNHKPSMLYLRDRERLDDLGLYDINGLTVAYDLVLLNRESPYGFFTQVFLEVGYAVANEKDQFDRNRGKALALECLKDGAMTKKNYTIELLGIGYDISATEKAVAEGYEVDIPDSAIPLRMVGKDGEEFPWVLQKDVNLTGIVQEFVIQHFNQNTRYN